MSYIIADIGGNIRNNVNRGKRLILAAKDAGADAVKLQLYRRSDLYVSEYLAENKQQNLDYDKCAALFEYANKIDIEIFSSVFSIEGIKFLYDKMGCRVFKLAAFEANRADLWNELLRLEGIEVHFSTGLLSNDDLERIYNAIKHRREVFIPYHSISNYKRNIRLKDLNLWRLKRINQYFPLSKGFSDHTEDHVAACYAACSGADYFEKHLKLSTKCPEVFALNPTSFKVYVRELRRMDEAIGDGGVTGNQLHELKSSVYAIKDIVGGERFTNENIRCFRGTNESAVSALEYIINTKSPRAFKIGELITKEGLTCQESIKQKTQFL